MEAGSACVPVSPSRQKPVNLQEPPVQLALQTAAAKGLYAPLGASPDELRRWLKKNGGLDSFHGGKDERDPQDLVHEGHRVRAAIGEVVTRLCTVNFEEQRVLGVLVANEEQVLNALLLTQGGSVHGQGGDGTVTTPIRTLIELFETFASTSTYTDEDDLVFTLSNKIR